VKARHFSLGHTVKLELFVKADQLHQKYSGAAGGEEALKEMGLCLLGLEYCDGSAIHVTDLAPHQKIKVFSYKFVEWWEAELILDIVLQHMIKKQFEFLYLFGSYFLIY
jgi:hypothetical protein